MNDGREYIFRSREFRDGDRDGIRRWLADLEELVALYPNVTVRDTHEVERVIEDHDLDEGEAALLRRIFGLE